MRYTQELGYKKTNLPIKNKDFFIGVILVIVAALLFVIGLLGDLFNFRSHVLGIGFEFSVIGLGAWLGLLFYYWARYTGRFDIFEPPIWISLNIYVQVILNVWLLQRDRLPNIPWVRTEIETVYPLVIGLFLIGLTTLWLSYFLFFRRLQHKMVAGRSMSISLVNTFLIWLLGTFAALYASLAGVGSYLGTATVGGFAWENYFMFISVVTKAAELALIIHIFRKPSLPGWIWFIFVVSLNLVIPLINGSKSFALNFLWILIAIYYARKKFPIQWALIGVAAVVLFVPVVNNYRYFLIAINTGRGVSAPNRAQALISTLGELPTISFNDLIESTSTTFERRQGSLLDITASVLVLHPRQLSFVGGQMFQEFIPQLIPRLIWPDKPAERSSLAYITSTYTEARSEYVFSEIGLVADSYRAGGLLTVVFFFIFLSSLLAYLYVQGPFRNNTPGIVLFIVIITQIIRYEGEISTTLLRLIQFVPLLWIIIFRVIYTKPENQETV